MKDGGKLSVSFSVMLIAKDQKSETAGRWMGRLPNLVKMALKHNGLRHLSSEFPICADLAHFCRPRLASLALPSRPLDPQLQR
jgi:hypothetical protein